MFKINKQKKMSNPNPEVYNINNDINIPDINKMSNQNQTTNVQILQHDLKNSTFPLLNSPEKNINDKKENEPVSTMMTQVPFIKELDKKEPIFELNKSLEKTDDTSNNSSSKETESKDQVQKNESFYQKTKRWAGTVWSYVNIANYFPKTEYKEYRNCNGDWVKIPIKKIPLKKKKVEETDEEHMINKAFDRNKIDVADLTGDRIPIPNFP